MPIIIKYNKPSKFDKAAAGIIWRVMGDNNYSELFIQVSHDSDNPKWETMGNFLEKAFYTRLEEELFIDECLTLFHQKHSPF